MNESRRRGFPKLFFGWWTVLTGCFLTLWGYGYNVYGISALFNTHHDASRPPHMRDLSVQQHANNALERSL